MLFGHQSSGFQKHVGGRAVASDLPVTTVVTRSSTQWFQRHLLNSYHLPTAEVIIVPLVSQFQGIERDIPVRLELISLVPLTTL